MPEMCLLIVLPSSCCPDMLAQKQAIFDVFADKSVFADATAKKEIELDDKTLGKLVQSEVDRINEKRNYIKN